MMGSTERIQQAIMPLYRSASSSSRGCHSRASSSASSSTDAVCVVTAAGTSYPPPCKKQRTQTPQASCLSRWPQLQQLQELHHQGPAGGFGCTHAAALLPQRITRTAGLRKLTLALTAPAGARSRRGSSGNQSKAAAAGLQRGAPAAAGQAGRRASRERQPCTPFAPSAPFPPPPQQPPPARPSESRASRGAGGRLRGARAPCAGRGWRSARVPRRRARPAVAQGREQRRAPSTPPSSWRREASQPSPPPQPSRLPAHRAGA